MVTAWLAIGAGSTAKTLTTEGNRVSRGRAKVVLISARASPQQPHVSERNGVLVALRSSVVDRTLNPEIGKAAVTRGLNPSQNQVVSPEITALEVCS